LEENWNFKTKFQTFAACRSKWLEGRPPAVIGHTACTPAHIRMLSWLDGTRCRPICISVTPMLLQT